MAGAGKGVEVRAPLLDRVVARAELHPIFGQPLAITTGFSLLTIWCGIICILPGQQEFAAVAALALAGTTATAWVLESSRLIWRARRRHASPRWLHAVRAVAGDDVTAHALARLIPRGRRQLDHVITRRDMIEQVGAERRRRREEAARATQVRMGGPAA